MRGGVIMFLLRALRGEEGRDERGTERKREREMVKRCCTVWVGGGQTDMHENLSFSYTRYQQSSQYSQINGYSLCRQNKPSSLFRHRFFFPYPFRVERFLKTMHYRSCIY